METEKFNFDARRKEWPLIEEVMGHFDGNQMISLLKAHAKAMRTGPTIKLYKDGKPVLRAHVGFGLYMPTYRFDALHILLNYMDTKGTPVEWDAVSFSGEDKIIPRDSGKALLDPKTSDIARYADIGLRKSFAQISELPTSRKYAESFNALLANTAIVEIHELMPKPFDDDEIQRMVREVLQSPRNGS